MSKASRPIGGGSLGFCSDDKSKPWKSSSSPPSKTLASTTSTEQKSREVDCQAQRNLLPSYDAHKRHQIYMRWFVGDKEKNLLPQTEKPLKNIKTDYHVLTESHRFLRTEEDDDGSWEASLARRYYDKLFKEYVICDLKKYKRGQAGFRWRTEAEVIQGRGQFCCSNKLCVSRVGLRSYEILFKYVENGAQKQALVKARVCVECAYKLNYQHLKRSKRKWREAEAAKGSGTKRRRHNTSDRSDEDSEAKKSSEELPRDSDDAEDEEVIDENVALELEGMAWKGPREEEVKTRRDEFDDYFRDMFQ